MAKRRLKQQIDSLINGGDDRQVIAITIQRPDGSRFLYGSWPPHPTLRPGDEVLNIEADTEATGDTLLKLRGLK